MKRIKLDREKKKMLEKENAWSEITNPKPGAPATKAERKRKRQRRRRKSRRKKRRRKKERRKKRKTKKRKKRKRRRRRRKKRNVGRRNKKTSPTSQVRRLSLMQRQSHILIRRKDGAKEGDLPLLQVRSDPATSTWLSGIVGMERTVLSRMIPS